MKKFLQIFLYLNFVFVGISFAQNEVKEIDFNNFTYQPSCGNAQPRSMTVTKDLYFEEKEIPQVQKKKQKTIPQRVYERKYFKPYETIYGDLNGDGIDEAIVLTTCSNGGIESYSEGFIYGIKDGNAELLARIEGGDRALGGLRSVKIDNGIISIERSRPDFTGNACCPEFAETTKYRFVDGGLSLVGDKTSFEIYPPTRIMFTDGTDQTSFDLNIPKRDEFVRFVVSGQKGQTLTVSTTSKDARLRLYKGNAKLVVNPKPIKKTVAYRATEILTAELLETGDYVFEVSNLSDSNVDLNVTVSVQLK